MNKILSISIASYNVEKFIKQALDSYIKCKSKDKLEILVINDGSTDNTSKIVGDYVKKYPSIIKLITQKNAGPGSTVNTGLKNATGKYFRMIDGDDWVNTKEMDEYIDYLENNNSDMIITNFIMVDDKTFEERPKKINIELEDKKEYKFDDICSNLHLDMHNITYKTSLIKGKLKIDNCFYTDTEYALYPIEYVKTVSYLSNHIYMYRVSLDTQSMNINSLQKHCDMHELVLNHLITYFNRIKDTISSSRKMFILKRISEMVGTQLYIYLSYDRSKIYKEKIKKMINDLKVNNSEIYKIIKSKKSIRLLELSFYLAYPILNKRIRNKDK